MTMSKFAEMVLIIITVAAFVSIGWLWGAIDEMKAEIEDLQRRRREGELPDMLHKAMVARALAAGRRPICSDESNFNLIKHTGANDDD
jgi:hypothetical protein